MKGSGLPQIIKCKKCSTVLYEGEDLKPPDEILQQYDGKCPKCGRKLSYEPFDVKVKKVRVPLFQKEKEG